jgi:hypothetical protein
MPLTGDQARQLHDAILSAFSRSDLEQLIRHELNEGLDAIAGSGPLSEVVFELILWADQRGRTEELIRAVQRARPVNPEIQSAAAVLLASLEVSTPHAGPVATPQSANRIRIYSRPESKSDTARSDWKAISILVVGILLVPLIGLAVALLTIPYHGTLVGTTWSVLTSSGLLLALLLVAYLFRPRSSSTVTVWRIMLAGLFSTFALLIYSQTLRELLVRWLIEVVRRLGVDVPSLPSHDNLLPYFIILCVTIAILAIAWLRLQRTITSPTPQHGDLAVAAPAADGPDFPKALSHYCGALIDYLNRYDRDVNWSDRDYTPLEAEVEAERAGRLRPRVVTNLVKAIRRDRHSATFVVMGDPGSGKSVSLRNLVRTL